MKIESDELRPDGAPVKDDNTVLACEACGHDLSLHDAIATRYCLASSAQAGKRGCVCSDAAKGAPPPAKGTPPPEKAPTYGRGRFSGR
jgi:hypothetical protein